MVTLPQSFKMEKNISSGLQIPPLARWPASQYAERTEILLKSESLEGDDHDGIGGEGDVLWKCFPRCREIHRLVARWSRHLAAWLSKPLTWVYFYFFLGCLFGLCSTFSLVTCELCGWYQPALSVSD